MLAAKRKIKNYTIQHVFLREDLLPEVRQARAQNRNKKNSIDDTNLQSNVDNRLESGSGTGSESET